MEQSESPEIASKNPFYDKNEKITRDSFEFG